MEADTPKNSLLANQLKGLSLSRYAQLSLYVPHPRSSFLVVMVALSSQASVPSSLIRCTLQGDLPICPCCQPYQETRTSQLDPLDGYQGCSVNFHFFICQTS